jgi:hypothetical protein
MQKKALKNLRWTFSAVALIGLLPIAGNNAAATKLVVMACHGEQWIAEITGVDDNGKSVSCLGPSNMHKGTMTWRKDWQPPSKCQNAQLLAYVYDVNNTGLIDDYSWYAYEAPNTVTLDLTVEGANCTTSSKAPGAPITKPKAQTPGKINMPMKAPIVRPKVPTPEKTETRKGK